MLGRRTSDSRRPTLGNTVDGTVRRVDTAYGPAAGPICTPVTPNTSGTTIVNQVEQLYNGLGQLITEYQSHSGAVNVSTTPKVQYAYSFVGTSGGPNHSRIISMTYPNGRVLNYNYNSGVDDRISRLSSLSDSSATLEAYSYLGLSTIVQRSHPQNGVNETYIIPGGNTDGGDQYTGLDRFGRVVEVRWVNVNTSTVTDDFLYSYDRDGNVLNATNALNSSFTEQYSYDGLNRLVSFTRQLHRELEPGRRWQLVERYQCRQHTDAHLQQPKSDHVDLRGKHAAVRCQRQYAGRPNRHPLYLRRLEPRGDRGRPASSLRCLGRCIQSAATPNKNDLYYYLRPGRCSKKTTCPRSAPPNRRNTSGVRPTWMPWSSAMSGPPANMSSRMPTGIRPRP